MGKVGVSLRQTQTTCGKPECHTGSRRFNRHHLSHEFMFVSCFASSRVNEAEYRRFCKRYFEYRPSDTVVVCVPHHVEIHFIYDEIIQQDIKRRKKPLRYYNWYQARHLMQRLFSSCKQWLDEPSDGVFLDMSDIHRSTKGGYHNLVHDLRAKGII